MVRARSLLACAAVSFVLFLSGCGGGGSSNGNSTGPLSITTSTAPQGVVGVAYNLALTATGGATPYAWSLSNGNLPAGLALSRDGVISGTPTAPVNSSFTIGLTDSQHPPAVATAVLAIQINATLSITTSALPNGNSGIPYSVQLSVTGGVFPYKFSITQGGLPAGLTLDPSKGVISGTPTGSGTSNFTLAVSDSANPADSTTAALSLVIAPPPPPPPPMGAVMYVQEIVLSNFQRTDVAGLAIAKDGSLSPLPWSPAPGPLGYMAVSTKAPSAFVLTPGINGPPELDALIVNLDYSLSPYTSANLSGSFITVDPSGQNLYLAQSSNQFLVLTADGVFTIAQTLALSAAPSSPMVFTPDAKIGFTAVCPDPGTPTILSFARAQDGTLTQVGSVSLSSCPSIAFTESPVSGPQMAVSPDGKYLANIEGTGIQIYSISAGGTLTAVLSQPFQVTLNNGALVVPVFDLTWDASSTYLLAATGLRILGNDFAGGLAVLSFSGSALTETVVPSERIPLQRVVRTNSFVYAMEGCALVCRGGPIHSYSFENGQLTPLPGTPYMSYGQMVIY